MVNSRFDERRWEASVNKPATSAARFGIFMPFLPIWLIWFLWTNPLMLWYEWVLFLFAGVLSTYGSVGIWSTRRLIHRYYEYEYERLDAMRPVYAPAPEPEVEPEKQKELSLHVRYGRTSTIVKGFTTEELSAILQTHKHPDTLSISRDNVQKYGGGFKNLTLRWPEMVQDMVSSGILDNTNSVHRLTSAGVRAIEEALNG